MSNTISNLFTPSVNPSSQTSNIQAQLAQIEQELQQSNQSSIYGPPYVVSLSQSAQNYLNNGGSAAVAGVDATSSQPQSFHSDLEQLSQALNNGDLSGAQAAYSALSQTAQFQNIESQAGSNGGQGSSFAQALAQIGSDLQNNDLTDAQSTLTSLQQQFQANASSGTGQNSGVGGHHHHHHHGGGESEGSQSASASSASGSSSGNNASNNPLLNVLNSIENTLTSIEGDLSVGTSTAGVSTANTTTLPVA